MVRLIELLDVVIKVFKLFVLDFNLDKKYFEKNECGEYLEGDERLVYWCVEVSVMKWVDFLGYYSWSNVKRCLEGGGENDIGLILMESVNYIFIYLVIWDIYLINFYICLILLFYYLINVEGKGSVVVRRIGYFFFCRLVYMLVKIFLKGKLYWRMISECFR